MSTNSNRIRRGIELVDDIEIVEAPIPDGTILFADSACLVMSYGGKLESEWEEDEVVWLRLTTNFKPKDLDRLAKVLDEVPDGAGLDFAKLVSCVWEADLDKIEANHPLFFQATNLEELIAVNSEHDFSLVLSLQYYRAVGFQQEESVRAR